MQLNPLNLFFHWQTKLYFVNIKKNRMWHLQHTQKKVGTEAKQDWKGYK